MRIRKLLTVTAMVCVWLQPFNAWATGPTISFGYEVTDLGQVSAGQKVTVRFPFANAGDGDLVVQDVRADCGCTEISEASREVPPRGRSEIVAVLDTTGAPGKKQRHILVRSNDPLRPIVNLTLVVEVVSE
jgi:hypothetical protein